MAGEIDRPISFALIQIDPAPRLGRDQQEVSAAAHAAGSRLYPQIAARPFGMLFGFPGHHAFTHRPTYPKMRAELEPAALAARLAEPAVRSAILSERDLPVDKSVLFDDMFAVVQHSLGRLYAIGDPPDYEPTPERTVAAIAGRRLMQHASGYAASVVSGVITRRDGVDTGARPGRLVHRAR